MKEYLVLKNLITFLILYIVQVVARHYDFVSDVTPAKETWRIEARIIRLWKVPVYGSLIP